MNQDYLNPDTLQCNQDQLSETQNNQITENVSKQNSEQTQNVQNNQNQPTQKAESPHYEISNSQKYEDGMYIYATCKKCDQFYGNPNNPIAQNLNLTIKYISNDSFQFFMSGMNFTKEFELPFQDPFWSSQQQQIVSQYSVKFSRDDSQNFFSGNIFQSDDQGGKFNKRNFRNYLISIRDNPLEVIVTRKATEQVIFFFSSVDLIYSENYKFINVTTNTNQIFGLGERPGGFYLKDGNYTLWNQQYDPERLDKTYYTPNMNGFHPVYLSKEKKTSSALEVEKKQNNLCYKILGGQVNFVIFLGDGKPANVIKDFHQFVGEYIIPPFWSLGIHHKFYNFKNLNDLQDLRNNFTSNNLSLDVLWFDQSYLYNGQAFNYDHQSFPYNNLTQIFPNINFIPSMQPGVKIADSVAYIDGVRRNVFITDDKQTVYSGKNDNGDSVLYPDFFSTQIYDFWNEMFGILYNDFKFNGIYFYQNEVTDFTNYKKFTAIEENQHNYYNFNKQIQGNKINKQGTQNNYKYQDLNVNKVDNQDMQNMFKDDLNFNYIKHHDFYDGYNNYESQNQLDQSEFFYEFLTNQNKLYINSLPLNGTHSNKFKEYYTHNLFNIQQTYLTYNYLNQWAKLPLNFVISKSSFTGLGKYGGHLVDEQFCTWDPLFLVYDIDVNIFENPKFVEEQLLIGNYIMACPILTPDTIAIDPYFPQDNWFDFYSGIQVKNKQDLGGKIRIQNDIQSKIPLYVKGGTIIPLQTYENGKNLQQMDKNNTLLTSFIVQQNGDLSSKGTVLGLIEFSEQNIYDKCVQQNCLIDINANAVTVVERFPQQSYYNITFSFRSQVSGQLIDDLYINQFIFFGLSENKMTQNKTVIVKNGVGDFSLTVTL
ncbi:Glycoside hydrolase, superfamily [Pseudocohnilembus persalinus]|uniref:Glycoside hydrolase, superfamily n=1 Tax=Pseudocohnilembus persalinus TaxID=266149 RepID=A0A0V0QCW2_PSEPJ|nr:Glycoside hydrolase, superfamily [Pseudocohnilembus persalinus]|eukprot:KRW99908.1 Glycoside hydrolase, superfamily [Pseudocohnilembus persalinus]